MTPAQVHKASALSIAAALDALASEVECTADAQLIARRANEWRAEARDQQIGEQR